MTIDEIIQQRYSCRVFEKRKIDDQLINEILDLTRLSPSSLGLEPWHFIVVSKKDDILELGKIAKDQEHVKNCSHIIAIVSRNDIQEKDEYLQNIIARKQQDKEKFKKVLDIFGKRFNTMSKEEINHYCALQCYLACANLVNIAYSKGVQSCIIGGFDAKKANEFFKFNDTFNTVLLISLGYGSPTNNKPKLRKKLNEVVTWI
ncbi:nitroreductase family protein [Campylobacter sp. RM12327]|uniref:nitroreductase family protein n=1 Tax=Campylobacter sputorum TaxID=206 RepID=UPI000B76C83A|nr:MULTISPECIES: nitroreductase family protein [Campylobacter]ASM40540.1 nitroreductase [Campylobacter sputorum]MBE7357795.1 nitroreductase family protein [Campylobacter sp. RM11302]MBF6669073.1 nitroreductase family protein [Campylobacter sp. RM12327]MBF6673918.1 nitroreductase family protein [Campylobacter sp. RM13538]MBF6675813.1 nitroreductase family protein [Campylobacter sp. RM12321]